MQNLPTFFFSNKLEEATTHCFVCRLCQQFAKTPKVFAPNEVLHGHSRLRFSYLLGLRADRLRVPVAVEFGGWVRNRYRGPAEAAGLEKR